MLYEDDNIFHSPHLDTSLIEPPPPSPLLHALEPSSEQLEQVMQLQEPRRREGTILLELAVDPEQQSVRPEVKGKSPPFGHEETLSPSLGHHSQLPSTILSEVNEDLSAPFVLLQQDPESPRTKELVQFLLENIELPSNVLEAELQRYCEGDQLVKDIGDILIEKFKGAKKSREELMKYSVRKACGYIEQIGRTNINLKQNDFGAYAKQYSSALHNRLLTNQKINAQLLSKMFEDEFFKLNYHRFLQKFLQLASDDNQHKISYLVDQINYAYSRGDVSLISSLKRVPWTKKLIEQAKKVAIELSQGTMKGKAGRKTKTP